mmetsp:Transcript_50758/g.77168  ORF Transcript_50758/g.77168 Transcript_50758/m.77168 type:complete len:325 (-) Transcript_50758:153-1127(-)|eukprot:CAMPEP_0117010958 /NCGR_PEP_ID=MMETSP0472-20121206/9525_1 /TAXON_ID=693140 ORGANISM="Tiarina fusus, Strain LIS" /NCGR_SAMPLE_ID=MMETSP0472 /ASSEMBLY_ACC=CAM_ASM_000603 /LENGTH=324 /DNA_ID=CAMNT_0004713621 /DNA_START=43 /DNA_END=1017 /DNA_ORIENTATION=-
MATMKANHGSESSPLRWWIGLALSSIFTLAYFLAPLYTLSSVLMLVCRWPSLPSAVVFSLPLIISALIPPIASPWVLKNLAPMLDYFEYEQIIESSPVDVRANMINGKNYILAVQPHGVLSFCAICSAVYTDKEFQGTIPTGVASALLSTPILKHVMGVFYLISASKPSLKKQFKLGGIQGSVVLYVGGMAELFLSSVEEETLYLKKRKGFIKLALQEGVDVVPLYLFGNTTVLSVLKTGALANLSRKLQVSLTYFWGRWGLPIPRDEKLLYVGGQPLGLPKIENPSQEEIDKWHQKYCDEVTRLFDSYKEKVPAYKHKKLVII